MNQTQIRTTELATQQADANKAPAPMMMLDDEALKHVAGGGPAGGWSDASIAASGPAGGW